MSEAPVFKCPCAGYLDGSPLERYRVVVPRWVPARYLTDPATMMQELWVVCIGCGQGQLVPYTERRP